VYPNLVLKPDAGWDILYQGTKIDVKTTRYINGRLLAKLNSRDEEVDAYLLVTGTFPEYNVIGYASRDSLLSPENIIDLGHGKGYGLSQEQLTPVEELVKNGL
jgi:hypothetical protein